MGITKTSKTTIKSPRNKLSHTTSYSSYIARKSLLFACFCLLCISCGESSFYEQYLSIEDRHWEKEKEYYFTFEITDTSIAYDVTVEIRNNNLYPFQNLWLFALEEQPSGGFRRDTIECMLADDYGKWLGTGISLYQSSFPLHSQYHFKEEGTYTLGFRQGMRNDRLPGIQNIGLRISKVTRTD